MVYIFSMTLFFLIVSPLYPIFLLQKLYWMPWQYPFLSFPSLFTLLVWDQNTTAGFSFTARVSHSYTPDHKSKNIWTTIFLMQGASRACFTCLQIIPPDLAFLRCYLVTRSPMKSHMDKTMYWSPQAGLLPTAGTCKDSIKVRSKTSAQTPNTDI